MFQPAFLMAGVMNLVQISLSERLFLGLIIEQSGLGRENKGVSSEKTMIIKRQIKKEEEFVFLPNQKTMFHQIHGVFDVACFDGFFTVDDGVKCIYL